MKLHKLIDGEVLKILPIIRSDGSKVNFIKTTFAYAKPNPISGKLLYDESGYLDRIYSKCKHYKINFGIIGTKYFFSVFIDSEIEFIQVGKSSISDILLYYDFGFYSNQYLKISKHMVSSMEYSLPVYDKSEIITDINFIEKFSTEKEQDEWIIKNQPNIDVFLKTNGVGNNKQILIDAFGDIVSEITSEDRNIRIEKIFSESV